MLALHRAAAGRHRTAGDAFGAEQVIRLTGSSSVIEARPLPVDDPKVRQPDITRATTILGWGPKVPLEDGLKHTIEYFRKRLAR